MAFDEFKGDFAPLVRMVHNHAKNRPTGVAMRQKEFGIWKRITWEGLQEIMQATAAGLVDLKTGDVNFIEINLNCNLWSEKVMAKAAAQAGFSHADLLETLLAESWRRNGLISA